jgi:UDP-glucuronate decarboxylase
MPKLFVDSDIAEIVASVEPIHSAFEGKSVLITGGGGFLGRYFSAVFERLNADVFAEKCRVTVVDNFISANNPSYEEGERGGVTYVRHDVIQPFESNERYDYIMHAAGIASPYYYRAFPLETIEVSVTGTRRMLQRAEADGARLLFFSSSEIYGDPDPAHVPTSESYRGSVSCLGARACYDESKRVGETLCRVYHTHKGLHTNMVRPFNVYGPGMSETDYRVLPNFAGRIRGGLPLKIYGAGSQTRTFCYVTDAIAGFLKTLVKGVAGEPYNIGNPRPEISMIDLAKKIGELLAKDVNVDLVEYPDSYPADEPNRRCPDISKARIHLGYEPKVDLDEGLRRFFQWTSKNFSGVVG